MDDDTCPHCGHLWDNHDGLLTGSSRCDVCDCMWQEPKPPPEPPTERDLFVGRVASLIHHAVQEYCDGYTDEYGVVDGDVDFSAVAAHLIDALKLQPPALNDLGIQRELPDCGLHGARPCECDEIERGNLT